MAGTTIGKAALILTTDAKQAKAGLDKFGGETKTWASQQSQALKGQFNAALRGGIIGGFLGGSLQSTFQDLITKTLDWATGLDAVKQKLADAQKQLVAFNDSLDRSLKLSAEWRASLTSPADKANSLEADLAKANKALKFLLENRGKLEGDIAERARSKFGSSVDILRGSPILTAQLAGVDDVDTRIKKVGDTIADLKLQLNRTITPSADPKVMADYNRALQEQFERLSDAGLDTAEKIEAKFTRLGLPPNLVADLRKMTEAADLAEHRLKNLPAANLGLFLGPALSAAGLVAEKIRAIPAPTLDNAALTRGSAAEVNLRLKSAFGGQINEQLVEQKKSNAFLGGIEKGVQQLNQNLRPATGPALGSI